MSTGLRERKNLRVQRAIQRAALELAIEHGFEQTTVADIAERADVAPRTVYTRFPTKEAIVLSGLQATTDALIDQLRHGTGGTADRLEAFVHAREETDDPDLHHLRQRAVHADPQLRMLQRGQLDRLEAVFTEVIAEETGATPHSAGARACAAAATGILGYLQTRFLQQPDNIPGILNDAEQGLAVLRAAMHALNQPSEHPGRSSQRRTPRTRKPTRTPA